MHIPTSKPHKLHSKTTDQHTPTCAPSCHGTRSYTQAHTPLQRRPASLHQSPSAALVLVLPTPSSCAGEGTSAAARVMTRSARRQRRRRRRRRQCAAAKTRTCAISAQDVSQPSSCSSSCPMSGAGQQRRSAHTNRDHAARPAVRAAAVPLGTPWPRRVASTMRAHFSATQARAGTTAAAVWHAALHGEHCQHEGGAALRQAAKQAAARAATTAALHCVAALRAASAGEAAQCVCRARTLWACAAQASAGLGAATRHARLHDE